MTHSQSHVVNVWLSLYHITQAQRPLLWSTSLWCWWCLHWKPRFPSVCTSVYLYHQSVHICISVSAADRNVVHTVISSTPVVFTLCFLDSELIAPLRQNAKVSLESFWGTGSSSSWWSSLLDCITNVCSSSRSQQPRDWTFLSHVDCFSQCETSQSGNRVSTSLGNSGRCWTIFARNRDTAVPAEGNGNLQTLICVLVARPRLCLTLSNPVCWQNWMTAYLGYTLRMKMLFCGWPVMVHDTHTRRRMWDFRSSRSFFIHVVWGCSCCSVLMMMQLRFCRHQHCHPFMQCVITERHWCCLVGYER